MLLARGRPDNGTCDRLCDVRHLVLECRQFRLGTVEAGSFSLYRDVVSFIRGTVLLGQPITLIELVGGAPGLGSVHLSQP